MYVYTQNIVLKDFSLEFQNADRTFYNNQS